MEPSLISENSSEVPKNFDYELSVLVLAKKLKLSPEELNMFTLNEFMKYVNMYIGDDEQEKEATQNDIDSFYAF